MANSLRRSAPLPIKQAKAETIRCTRCGHLHSAEPVKSPKDQRLGQVRTIYRDRNRHPGLADDREGRIFLMILLALGLPLEDVDNLASWITLKELAKIK